MEATELSIEKEKFVKEMEKLKVQKEELGKSSRDSCKDLNDFEKFNLHKAMLESKSEDLERRLIMTKKYVLDRYDSIRRLREKVEIEKAAFAVKRNEKRRVSRAMKKANKRIKRDNNLSDNEIEEEMKSGETSRENGEESELESDKEKYF
jgi:hypothetical protein